MRREEEALSESARMSGYEDNCLSIYLATEAFNNNVKNEIGH
jgi:hypothetical protein